MEITKAEALTLGRADCFDREPFQAAQAMPTAFNL
jgi:hypothetical protein